MKPIFFTDDHDALIVLDRGGYLVHRGSGIIVRHRKGTEHEEAAIKYLCDEYDYAWEAGENQPEAVQEPEDIPYDEDSTPHLGDREDLSTRY